MQLVVEPSGATALAGALSKQFLSPVKFRDLRKVGIVISGGNVDLGAKGFWQLWNVWYCQLECSFKQYLLWDFEIMNSFHPNCCGCRLPKQSEVNWISTTQLSSVIGCIWWHTECLLDCSTLCCRPMSRRQFIASIWLSRICCFSNRFRSLVESICTFRL